MGESLLVLTIVSLIVLTIVRARPVVLDNPVVLHRPGKYHMTLASKLNGAQTFVESIDKQLVEAPAEEQDSQPQYFRVYDDKLCSKKEQFYLLAVARRAGMTYFQAIKRQVATDSSEDDLKLIREFSDKVLAEHPVSGDAKSSASLNNAVTVAAEKLHIKVDAITI